MPWEKRGTKLYYYRKKRVGARVVKTYVGGGEAGERAAAEDEANRIARKQAAGAARAFAQEADITLDYLRSRLAQQGELLAGSGYHIDRDGALRKMDRRTTAKETGGQTASEGPN